MTETPEDKAIKGDPVLPAAEKAGRKLPVIGQTTPDDLDAAYAEIRKAPYVFTWAGREFSLPHLAELDFRLQMKIEEAQSLDAKELLDLFDEMFGEQQAADFAKVTMPTGALFMLFERWLAHSGAKPGEDSASTGSSGTTGKRSRQTSAGSTGSGSPKRSTAKEAAKRAPRKAVTVTPSEVLASPPASSSA